jgi:hypothetical protein
MLRIFYTTHVCEILRSQFYTTVDNSLFILLNSLMMAVLAET